jgi:hypothetical protein
MDFVDHELSMVGRSISMRMAPSTPGCDSKLTFAYRAKGDGAALLVLTTDPNLLDAFYQEMLKLPFRRRDATTTSAANSERLLLSALLQSLLLLLIRSLLTLPIVTAPASGQMRITPVLLG